MGHCWDTVGDMVGDTAGTLMGTRMGHSWDMAGTWVEHGWGHCWDMTGTLLGHCWDTPASGKLLPSPDSLPQVFFSGDCVGSFIYIFLQSGAELFNHEGKFNLFADKTVKYCNPADLLKPDPNRRAVQKSETPLPLGREHFPGDPRSPWSFERIPGGD